ncbi:ComEC/Rec2 family competence protein [Jiella avicenniae]|uniref:ComEC/Rec2 family competence protein n=1 Tax=Jiella avicenniae TaxID=2907202 RepID=A0A9X1NZK9_9HYPH|nr:ComEC/Rec2 family competence protein [Jiella avicenniae]MCE7027773.1 ComEC/Rec2 family competence protein [Jiella avicenniae]
MPQAPLRQGRQRPGEVADAAGRLLRLLRGPGGASDGDEAGDGGGAWQGGSTWRDAVTAWFARQFAVEAAHRSGFHILPVALIAGAAAVFAIDWRPNVWATIAVAALFAALALRAAALPVRRAILLALVGLLAGVLVSIGFAERSETTIISGTATTRIAGRVLSVSRDEKGRMRYVVAITGTVRPVLSRPPRRARILVGAKHAPKSPGDPYYGLVRIGPPSGPAAPGRHDFAYQPFFDGVGAIGFSLGRPDDAPTDGLSPPPPAGVVEALSLGLERLRGTMTARISEAAGGGEAGAIAAALVTGERAGISEDAETWLRGVGLAHVLSISGLHLAIVAGSALLVVRSALALVPGLALRYPVKKAAAVAALVVAALYLLLSGANVATQRAFVMLAVMLVAVIADRPALTIRNVSLAALIVVVVAPHMVTTASFQMSFAATLALVAGYRALARWQERKAPSVPRPLAMRLLRLAGGTVLGIVASSIIAGAATAPYAAYHFHRVAPFGLVANVLTLPLFTFLIMPLGLVGSLLMPFGLDAWAFYLMGRGVDLVLAISEWLYGVLPDRSTGPIAGAGVVFLTAALFAAALFASRLRLVAFPLAVVGLLTIRDTSPLPQLLVHEDGKTVATFAADGAIGYLQARRNGFVADQWERSFGSEPPPGEGDAAAPAPARIEPPCDRDFCRFQTRDGLRVVWTSDYRRTGEACDGGDIAIVARAIRLETCRSGAALVTLRTLRRTGSLAFSRDVQTGRAVPLRSVPADPQPWNRHRLAPWPEYWKKPAAPDEEPNSNSASAR